MSKNIIPRKFKKILGRFLITTSAGAPADWKITKDEYGYHGINLDTGDHYTVSVSHLRNPEIFEIIEIVQ